MVLQLHGDRLAMFFLGFKGNGGRAMSVFVASMIGAEDVGQATSRKLPLVCHETNSQWIGLRENLQESPIFNGKIYGFRLRFSL
jgi:hypothetical protein